MFHNSNYFENWPFQCFACMQLLKVCHYFTWLQCWNMLPARASNWSSIGEWMCFGNVIFCGLNTGDGGRGLGSSGTQMPLMTSITYKGLHRVQRKIKPGFISKFSDLPPICPIPAKTEWRQNEQIVWLSKNCLHQLMQWLFKGIHNDPILRKVYYFKQKWK